MSSFGPIRAPWKDARGRSMTAAMIPMVQFREPKKNRPIAPNVVKGALPPPPKKMMSPGERMGGSKHQQSQQSQQSLQRPLY